MPKHAVHVDHFPLALVRMAAAAVCLVALCGAADARADFGSAAVTLSIP